MISPDLPDTRYDYTHPWWFNANDRVAYERSFQIGEFEDRQVAQALLSGNPGIPNKAIRAKNNNAAYVPPRFGYDDTQPTIDDILEVGDLGHVEDAHTTDFSGRLSNTEASSRPGIYW